MNMRNENGTFKNVRVYWLAFVVYWGIVLFGYDTGIGGGVVSAPYFQKSFGLLNEDGSSNTKRSNEVSSNVVSVLQAGAFFGALGSAPISAGIGRIHMLSISSTVFLVGAALTTAANDNSHGLTLIYAGRAISGLGIGAISAVAPAYVSECAPKEVAVGVMISYFINFGVGIRIKSGVDVWRIPFSFQLVPSGIMALGLLTIKESPRWLASVGRHQEAIANLAYLRRDSTDSDAIIHEMAEIATAIVEEMEARKGLGIKEAFFGKGNFIRFVIAFVIFLLQQWTGQNSVGYYAPQIFASIGYIGTKNSLLASGIYGVVKVVATTTFVFFDLETLGRKFPLFISAMGMGTLFFIIGSILKTHPPPSVAPGVSPPSPPMASRAMAGMLYIHACFFAMGWGPIPWVYVSEIFPTRTRNYGLALASATQWLFNFVVSKVTPDMISNLGYKIFLMFAAVDIGAMGLFSLLIPETKGRSLEEMDVIFGSITAEQRQGDINKQQQALERKHEDQPLENLGTIVRKV